MAQQTQQMGTLLIPDISGYTQFLSEVELSHGRHIIAELLEIVINADKLRFKVSEVEGDAVLFYRFGPPPAFEELESQVKATYLEFHQYLRQIERDTICQCGACQRVGSLTLKFVSHYGELALTAIKDHVKLIGTDVIIAHRLLKNSHPSSEYLLMTESLLQAARTDPHQAENLQRWVESYKHLGDLTVYVQDLGSLQAKVPSPPEPRYVTQYPKPIVVSKTIHAPMSTVYDLLFDFERMPEWNPGLKKVEYDPELPMRVGMAHNCLFDGATMKVTLDRVLNRKDEMVVTNRLGIPAPVLNGSSTYHLKREADHLHLNLIFSYKRYPIIGWLMDRLFVRKRLTAILEEICERLKQVAERSQALAVRH